MATQYRVYAVPKTVINQTKTFEGAMPENYFVDTIVAALQPPDKGVKA